MTSTSLPLFFIDTHCHLFYDYEPKSLDHIVQQAQDANVRQMITISTDVASWEKNKTIAESYDAVHFSVGIHPHDVLEATEDAFEHLSTFLEHPKCVALGEMGVDTHYDHTPLPLQLEVLRRQLLLSNTHHLPVVIHSRGAEDVLLDTLKAYHKPELECKGIIHCFTGTPEFGRACLEQGYLLSFSGIVTFKNAEPLRAFMATLSLKDFVIETDAPYLAPTPFRGKKCEPAMIVQTATAVAAIFDVSIDTLQEAMMKNTYRVCPKLYNFII